MLTESYSLTIDPDGDDDYIPIELAHLHVPGRPHRATIWRWLTRGIQCGDVTVKLKTVMVGRRRFTRREWLEEFLASCNSETRPDRRQSRNVSHDVAAARLDAMLPNRRG